MSTPETRTPRLDPEANAEEGTEAAILASSGESCNVSKRRANVIAALAIRGFAVHELSCGGFLVARWNLSRHCASLEALTQFARQVGALA